MTKKKTQIDATKTSFQILHILQDEGPSKLTELTPHVDIADSTLHRHLETLRDLRYVTKEDGRYQLGLRALRLGHAARTQNPLYQLTKPYVRNLAEETNERCQFVVEDHGLGVYIYMESGENAVQVTFDIGRHIHLHCSAAGKAILANLPQERVNKIIDQWSLEKHTENTITTREELFDELSAIRERRFALNDEEHVEGLRGIAAPILLSDDSVLGVISIAGPTHRLKGEKFTETVPNKILASTNEIELNISYDANEQDSDLVVD